MYSKAKAVDKFLTPDLFSVSRLCLVYDLRQPPLCTENRAIIIARKLLIIYCHYAAVPKLDRSRISEITAVCVVVDNIILSPGLSIIIADHGVFAIRLFAASV